MKLVGLSSFLGGLVERSQLSLAFLVGPFFSTRCTLPASGIAQTINIHVGVIVCVIRVGADWDRSFLAHVLS